MKRILLSLSFLLLLPVQLHAALGDSLGLDEEEILDPDQAFRVSARAEGGDQVVVRFEIAPHHYLYRDKFNFKVEGEGFTLDEVILPPGEEKDDEFFGRIQVYHDLVEARLNLQRSDSQPAEITVQARYQGCAEAGICYPPQKKRFTIALPAIDDSAPTAAITPDQAVPAAAPQAQQDILATALAGGNRWWTILSFFGLGLLLTFTPCVFPMIPILSGIITGHGESLTTRKAFAISLAYVLAMALTYTVVGVIAGLGGANLQIWFQNPWVLSIFAAIFVALSLSMFGFYELQMPSSVQSRISTLSNKQQGGTLTGAAVMGFLSALIVGPCVTAPLIGALIYIGQTGDAVLGGLALFALSMGMGTPLLLLGTSAGKLLPKAGAWMDAVKAVFGVLLLAVAIWLLERILPAAIILLLWALLLIVSAVYMGALEPVREAASGWRKLWKGLGLVLLIHGGLMLLGSAAGGSDPLQPLKGLAVGGGGDRAPAYVTFQQVKGLDGLERALAAANGRPVMLDFYADWCISCKELEKYTFSHPEVLAALDGVVTLQADVTANDEADKALLKHFKLIGPPAILFFDTNGKELRDYRLVGFLEPAEFAAHVQRAAGR